MPNVIEADLIAIIATHLPAIPDVRVAFSIDVDAPSKELDAFSIDVDALSNELAAFSIDVDALSKELDAFSIDVDAPSKELDAFFIDRAARPALPRARGPPSSLVTSLHSSRRGPHEDVQAVRSRRF